MKWLIIKKKKKNLRLEMTPKYKRIRSALVPDTLTYCYHYYYYCYHKSNHSRHHTLSVVYLFAAIQIFICNPCGIRFSSLSTLDAHQTYYCSRRHKKGNNILHYVKKTKTVRVLRNSSKHLL